MPEEKKKKKKPLKIIVICAVAIIIIAAIFGGGDDDKDKSKTAANDNVKIASNNDNSTQPGKTTTTAPTAEPTKEPDQTTYDAGTYKVGNDITAGEYVIFCDNGLSGYAELSSDSTGDLDSIVANENFEYNTIMEIKEGQYFKMTGAYAVPVDEIKELDTTGSGMFKIGTYLPAGEYKLTCTDETVGYGYYEVDKDASHNLDNVVANDNFEGDTYVTVKDGQYLKISQCKIVK
jgi:hypothetical protein